MILVQSLRRRLQLTDGVIFLCGKCRTVSDHREHGKQGISADCRLPFGGSRDRPISGTQTSSHTLLTVLGSAETSLRGIRVLMPLCIQVIAAGSSSPNSTAPAGLEAGRGILRIHLVILLSQTKWFMHTQEDFRRFGRNNPWEAFFAGKLPKIGKFPVLEGFRFAADRFLQISIKCKKRR